MKISKVEHRKTAVGIYREGDKGRGILYRDPSSGNAVENLDKIVRKRSENAAVLYSVLNHNAVLFEDDCKKQRIVRYIIQNFSSNFTGKSGLYRQGINLGNIQDIYANLQFRTVKGMDSLGISGEDLAQAIVDKALRNSLRRTVTWNGEKYYLPEIAVKLLFAVSICSDKKKVKEIPKKELLAFVGYVGKERKNRQWKTKKGEAGKEKDNKNWTKADAIADSIKKQNVKVQINQTGGKTMLMLSNSEHEKKRYIADFIKEFAGNHEQGQNEMIRHIKHLIVLYVYGPKKGIFVKNAHDPWMNIEVSAGADDLFQGLSSELFKKMEEEKSAKQERAYQLEFDREIRMAVSEHYRNALTEAGLTDSDRFWLQYFEGCVERYAAVRRKRRMENYSCGRICNYIWKEWFPYIAMKYIDMGKAVYNFAMPDLYGLDGSKVVEIGQVMPVYREGLTSFDYERIKAEESLIRNLAASVTFAANTYANAVVKNEFRQRVDEEGKKDYSDVLTYQRKAFGNPDIVRKGARRSVLQYFGGKSLWEESLKKPNGKEISDQELLIAMKEHLAAVRNESFHFTTNRFANRNSDKTVGSLFFEKEYGSIKRVIGEKYCSNNVPVFYPPVPLYEMMKFLYKEQHEREAQIPAFSSVFKKKDMRLFVDKFLGMDKKREIYKDIEVTDKYTASLFFLLKEIYYYGFLASGDLLEKFELALQTIEMQVKADNNRKKKEGKKEKDSKEKRAFDNFKKRYDRIKKEHQNLTFGQLCQQIMTDYNMQNQGRKQILSTEQEKNAANNGNKPIYQHFVKILYQTIEIAFKNYIETREVFSFLKQPRISRNYFELHSVDEFVAGVPEISIYKKVKTIVLKNDRAMDWYVTAHFMSARQINFLIGDLRNYRQYILKIDERAGSTGNRQDRDAAAVKVKKYGEILAVLEFVLQFAGRISRVITDYFDDDEDYARHIANYVDFGASDKYSLQCFCKTMMENAKSTDKALGIYYDASKPIPNKNVVYSVMYGDERLLANCMEKVTLEEIKDYYKRKEDLKTVFLRGECRTEEEQKKLKEFQNLKNRIELLDVQTYTELVNDIMAQMVSWAYLRERDLMYFQLGYHYVRLFYTDQVAPEHKYRKLIGDKIHITDGALLYQIVAMYDYSLPVYKVEDGGKAVVALAKGTAGESISPFIKAYCGETFEQPDTYYGGISFFENKSRHDDFVSMRKDIDHMKYYAQHKKSLWEMYADMYNGFLVYDTKLKKSVSFLSKNILERYFIVAKTKMTHSMKDQESKFRFCASELASDTFTYKYTDAQKKECKVEVSCRSQKFIEQLKKILEYKV